MIYIRSLINLFHREKQRLVSRDKEVFIQSSTLLFCYIPDKSSKSWDRAQLTDVIKSATKKAWNQQVTSQVLRQIYIDVTEKHICEVYKPFNRFDDVMDKADPNMIFAWQSRYRPLQRGSIYGLDGVFPRRLQPELLRWYEWASICWHEFLSLISKDWNGRQRKSTTNLNKRVEDAKQLDSSLCRKRYQSATRDSSSSESDIFQISHHQKQLRNHS